MKKLYWSSLALLKTYRAEGISGVRRRYGKREPLPLFSLLKPQILGATGLEIGGPTPMFRRGQALPVYAIAKRVDNCNFGEVTFFQGTAPEGKTFRFDWLKPLGYQYLLNAGDLKGIQSESYDFVLSSHNIEHLANPIGALHEWIRVLRPSGHLILVVPHKDGTFDHRRPVTTLEHLMQDFASRTAEDDETHFPEILALHDLGRDPSVASADELKDVIQRNFSERRAHHHVFDARLVAELLDAVGLQICDMCALRPFHIVAVARKSASMGRPDNTAFLRLESDLYKESPFVSDRSLWRSQ